MNELGATLKQYRVSRGRSIAQVADEAGVDRSYLYRLEAQEGDWLNRPLEGTVPHQPQRDLIIRLAFVLELSLDACDDLLLTAGYAPLLLPKPAPMPTKRRQANARS